MLLLAAAVGLCLAAAQAFFARRRLRVAPPVPCSHPPISIRKPLCGVDDDPETKIRQRRSPRNS